MVGYLGCSSVDLWKRWGLFVRRRCWCGMRNSPGTDASSAAWETDNYSNILGHTTPPTPPPVHQCPPINAPKLYCSSGFPPPCHHAQAPLPTPFLIPSTTRRCDTLTNMHVHSCIHPSIESFLPVFGYAGQPLSRAQQSPSGRIGDHYRIPAGASQSAICVWMGARAGDGFFLSLDACMLARYASDWSAFLSPS